MGASLSASAITGGRPRLVGSGEAMPGGPEQEGRGGDALDFDFSYAGQAVLDGDGGTRALMDIELDPDVPVSRLGRHARNGRVDASVLGPGKRVEANLCGLARAQAPDGLGGGKQGDRADVPRRDDGSDLISGIDDRADAKLGDLSDAAVDRGAYVTAFDLERKPVDEGRGGVYLRL